MDNKSKYEIITGMYTIIQSLNNENAYMEWINTVPDCATEDDFSNIIEDEELFNDSVLEFMRIYNKYIKDGLYIEHTLYTRNISYNVSKS